MSDEYAANPFLARLSRVYKPLQTYLQTLRTTFTAGLNIITRHHFSHASKSAYPTDLRSSAPTLRVGLRVLRTLLSSPQRGSKEPNPFTKASAGQALRATPAYGRRIPKCAIKDLRARLRRTRKSTRSRARLIALPALSPTKAQEVYKEGGNPLSRQYQVVLDIFSRKQQ